jgi:hypothetical protein
MAIGAWAASMAAAAALAVGLGAQEPEAGTPEAGAAAFYSSFQRGRWADMAASLHPDALASFQHRLLQVVRNDATGRVARQVFDAEPVELEAMSTDALFTRLLRGILGYAPGMMQAMTSKRIAIIGHVIEDPAARASVEAGAPSGAPSAHVVIRSREPLSGTAPSRVGVLSLAPDDGVWKVTWSEELDVIATALVAVPTPGETSGARHNREDSGTPPNSKE